MNKTEMKKLVEELAQSIKIDKKYKGLNLKKLVEKTREGFLSTYYNSIQKNHGGLNPRMN